MDFNAEHAAALVGEVANQNAQQLKRSLRAVRPDDDARSIALKIPELSAANVGRIAERTVKQVKGLADSMAKRVSEATTRAVSQGLRGEALAKELASVLGIERAAAKRLAVGEVIRISADVRRERHEKLGVTEYIWHAVSDGHARAWHWKLHNTRQSYTSPPLGGGAGPKDVGNPGTATGRACRCQDIPVFADPAKLEPIPAATPTPAPAAKGAAPPFESVAAFRAHMSERGLNLRSEKEADKLHEILGRNVGPDDVDAIIGRNQLEGIEGKRSMSVSVNGDRASFESFILPPGSEGGDDVIQIKRSFFKDGDKRVVVHDGFKVPERMQGGGFGKRVMQEQIRAYQRLGINEIRLNAEKVGQYYWPKLGFDVDAKVLVKHKEKFARFLKRAGVDEAGVARMTGDIKSMRDIATTVVGDQKLGKEYLLDADSIQGMSMQIDESNPAFKAMKKELGIDDEEFAERFKAAFQK